MKLLFFPGGSYIGGMEIVTLSLMQELQVQGHECFAVVSGWNDGRYPARLAEVGIPHQSIKLGRFYLSKPMWNLDGLVNFPSAASQLRAAIQEFHPDVTILTSIEFAVTVLQVLPKSLPMVLYVHDVPNRHWKSWMGRYVLARTGVTVSVSDFICGKVATITKDIVPMKTVHNGVPDAEYVPTLPSPKLRIGIIGQLIPRKKHETLVDAVGLLSPENRAQMEVRIYGNNTTEYARHISQKIEGEGLSEHFCWSGFVEAQREIYGELDVVVAAAIGEPFGLTVLEAACWEIPVIAARSGGFPETVRDGETGLLVEPNDPADLAMALQRLMDPAERQRLGMNARRHVLEHFSVPAMARNFIAALTSIGLKP